MVVADNRYAIESIVLLQTKYQNSKKAYPLINDPPPPVSNFIRNIVLHDLETGKHDKIVTRFPPEPNGHLHIGHAKSICLNFGIAAEFGGTTNLRFDDTNPLKESEDFAQAIMNDVRWLGFEWNELRHASDYFQQLYEYALHLVRKGKAYVDSQDAEALRSNRGTLKDPGTDSPYRNRSVEENIDLFGRMKNGEFADGEHVLRARIDMASANMNLRDPAIYRIRKVTHHRTGDEWNIYPMYDWAHGISDAIEGITHSLCTLEFEDHRPLYDWFLENIPATCHPQQIEFARGNLDFTVMSKRKLRQLVEEGHVAGWDDPRMPTIAGLRRRGYTAQSIRTFWREAGVSKAESVIPMGVLENAIRSDMNENAPRVMAVLDPIKVVLTNYPEGESEWLEAPSHPQNPEMGSRLVPLSREIWIERDDFMEDPPRKYFRLRPDGEVRLRNAFIIKCTDIIRDAGGAITEIHCEYDPDSRSGMPGASRKVKGTIHWVSVEHGINAEIRLYDRLFNVANPLADKERDFLEFLNPHSLDIVSGAIIEPAVARGGPGDFFQFERVGYFTVDQDSTDPKRPILNRTVSLRDSWAKMNQ
jgi:glutaminyl-tRNA synthetase